MSDLPHILILDAREQEELVDELVRGAVTTLDDAAVTHERLSVPTAFELPAGVRFAVKAMDVYTGRRRFDGYVVLGCVVRGETNRYDYVCAEVMRGLQDLVLHYTLALGMGVLTVESREQAWIRAATGSRNQGGAAARTCLDMIALKRRLRLFPR